MIIARQGDLSTARKWFEMCVQRGDTSGGIAGVDDLATGALIVVFAEDGKDCGAIALDFLNRQGGRVCFVNAAGGKRENGEPLLPAILLAVEAIAKKTGCAQICFDTRREGLIKAMQKKGYKKASVQMVKDLQYGE